MGHHYYNTNINLHGECWCTTPLPKWSSCTSLREWRNTNRNRNKKERTENIKRARVEGRREENCMMWLLYEIRHSCMAAINTDGTCRAVADLGISKGVGKETLSTVFSMQRPGFMCCRHWCRGYFIGVLIVIGQLSIMNTCTMHAVYNYIYIYI